MRFTEAYAQLTGSGRYIQVRVRLCLALWVWWVAAAPGRGCLAAAPGLAAPLWPWLPLQACAAGPATSPASSFSSLPAHSACPIPPSLPPQVNGKWLRLVRAALQHPLTSSQVQRLLDADKLLPVDLNIQMELHARSEPADCWYTQLRQRLRQEQRAEAAAAAVPAAPSRAANGAVPLGGAWVRQAAGKQHA